MNGNFPIVGFETILIHGKEKAKIFFDNSIVEKCPPSSALVI